MRLMLTGANGQVGWELRRSLMTIGDVIAMDRTGCDLARPGDLPRIISELKPDIIVNAAAYTAVDKAEDEEQLATVVNGTAVGVLADEARKSGALLIHYSTDYVFDGTKQSSYTEDDPLSPINAYGRSKLAGERAVGEAAGDFLILRTCWVYAARGNNFVRTVLRLARERDELRIVADQVGAPTWAREIADATALIVRQVCRERQSGSFKSGVFNMTAAGATSWHGFAEAILDQAMSRQSVQLNRPKIRPISSLEYPRPAARPKNSRLAGERLRARFGIALADWKQALALCMQEMALTETS
ncbi:MAG: dTDP-4-dehydrorhamnose reductase [Rhizobiales bacterium]|nr:dTDP-4-dehydrorhamnose reductase [Hyphomicrobiales bacterium]